MFGKVKYSHQIRSNPEHVHYEVKDRTGSVIDRGTTPAIVELKAGDFFQKGRYHVEFSESNYESVSTPIGYMVDPTFWLNIFNYGFGIPIDAATGAMWKPSANFVYVTMNPDPAAKPVLKSVQPAFSESTPMSYGDVDGKYYALIIGNNTYQDPNLMDLDQPIEDASKLYEVLVRSYTFEKDNVIFLKNATRKDIIRECDFLSRTLTSNDNLLIFYAGHGYWDEKGNVGYWFPADASRNSTVNWFRNSTLRDFIGSIQTKHTLLIADACFSGQIFKSRAAFTEAPSGIEKLYELPSRKAMTSGTRQEVPDESVFIKYLVRRLEENEEPYLTSELLFSSFKEAVMNNSPNIPQ
ncbi:MAG TPA: hypothetical protein DCX54_07610, partial [Flavobacteriales bacterium]|nr:hypothetical protein [Flavobacteriales bacterium]